MRWLLSRAQRDKRTIPDGSANSDEALREVGLDIARAPIW